jgi:hypothetical protein
MAHKSKHQIPLIFEGIMAKEVSKQSTKDEILGAYNELLIKVKEQKIADRKVEKRKEDEEKIVESALQTSDEKILKGLAELKLEFVKRVDSIGEQLMSEHKKLLELRQAIEIEKQFLDEIYDIKVNVDTLSALLAAQKEKRADFEADMEEKKTAFEEDMVDKRVQWKQEQEAFEAQRKERDALLKKERQREEDDFNYNLQLARKKDADQYEARKSAQEKDLADRKAVAEKELSEREALVAAKEQELADLRGKVESFPAELQRVKQETEQAVTERIEFLYKHNAELSTKEIEGERKLNKQMVVSLEAKIKEHEELIRQLTQKASDAGLQVQEIALKAIEGASAQRAVSVIHERSGDAPKG